MITNCHALPPPLRVLTRLRVFEKHHHINYIAMVMCSCTTTPSADPTQADIRMTKIIIETAKPLGIGVPGHIIGGRNGHASLKGMKLI
jgi:DNA repair protein RadC